MKLGSLKHEELLKEKTLWAIYKRSLSIKDSIFNWSCGILVFILFFAYCWVEPETKNIHNLLLKLAELGFNFAVSILGFLIAGFTIFASLAKPALLLTMLKHPHKSSGMSYLKYNFFTLVRVFIYFLVFAALQIGIIAMGQPEGLIYALIKRLSDLESILYFGNRFMLILSATFWVFVLMQLKSFVFNVHHIVMTMIKFDAVSHNARVRDGEQI
ncbi:hypothetical protein KBB96_18615 [Luteolibacter ambystomatis]|uniref:Uncharacterized protein n=1 Tax=Luteolibacter ambystomatis TaxID=2824561 RepID=A0A975G9K6_9BACT|nr:hypothetical protein [Luteolibacter ambystomatis]QUE50860.1 hypothetical protein KBB96_18615 [Luteolibacter ambystomatis]